MLENAEEIRSYIKSQLMPLYKDWEFGVSGVSMGEGASITFFQVPRGSSDLAAWNSPVYIRVTLWNAKGTPSWERGGPTPEKLEAVVSRTRGIKMRAKSGPAKQVVDYVVKWFKTNFEALTTPPTRVASVLRRIASAYLLRVGADNPHMTLEQALKIFGFGSMEDVTLEELKARYWKLIAKNHVDKFDKASPEGKDEASERTLKINLAREMLETGGKDQTTSPDPREEGYWESVRRRYRPKPSGHYTKADIATLLDKVFELGYFQAKVRHPVNYVPVDAVLLSNLLGKSYNRPFGSVATTKKMGPEERQKLQVALEAWKNVVEIFDLAVTKREAWITFGLRNGDLQSISFEPAVSKPKKAPGVGMAVAAVAAGLKAGGLQEVAGGSKYAYFSVPGTPKKGDFAYVRLGAKNLTIVNRKMDDDIKILREGEIYYGSLTPERLGQIIEMVKRYKR